FERFLKAISRFQERIVPKGLTFKNTENAPDHLFFNINKTHHKIYLKDILYIESLKDYVRIHTKKDCLVVKGNIGSVLTRFPEQDFVRIHRSFAVAIAHIEAYNQTELKIGGQQLPIGASFRDGFLDSLKMI
ncbi:MAG: LytTR family DNA-binding domain-containing protein, partial [Bacteroidota bacterium]